MEDGSSEDAFVIFLILISVVGTFANLVVLLTILGTKKLRNSSSVFLVNLTICDLITSTVSIPCVIGLSIGTSSEDSQVLCSIVGFISNSAWCMSILAVATIASERYYAIIHCFRYASLTSYRHILLGVSVTWVIPLALMCTAAFGWPHREVLPKVNCIFILEDTSVYGVFVVSMCFVIPLIAVLYSYVRVLIITKYHTTRIGTSFKQDERSKQIDVEETAHVDSQKTSGDKIEDISNPSRVVSPFQQRNSVGEGNSRKSKINESKTFSSSFLKLVCLTLAICVCFGPYFVLTSMFINNDHTSFDDINTSKHVSVVFCFCGCILHPFLYAIYSKRFRSALVILIRRVACKNTVIDITAVHSKIESTIYIVSPQEQKRPQSRRLSDIPEITTTRPSGHDGGEPPLKRNAEQIQQQGSTDDVSTRKMAVCERTMKDTTFIRD